MAFKERIGKNGTEKEQEDEQEKLFFFRLQDDDVTNSEDWMESTHSLTKAPGGKNVTMLEGEKKEEKRGER